MGSLADQHAASGNESITVLFSFAHSVNLSFGEALNRADAALAEWAPECDRDVVAHGDASTLSHSIVLRLCRPTYDGAETQAIQRELVQALDRHELTLTRITIARSRFGVLLESPL